jgi:hypothetical protein
MDALTSKKEYVRIRVSNKTLESLKMLLQQFKDEFGDMIGSKKDDAIDIMLSLRNYALSEKEIVEIRQKKFTALQRAKWLLKRVSEGNAECSDTEFETLMKQIRMSHKAKNEKRSSKSPSKEGDLSRKNDTKLS